MKKGAFAPRSSLFGPDGPLARHWGAGFLPGVRAGKAPYKVICDRPEAIRWAIDHHEPGDVILLCGKGHEDYQIIGHEKIHMDEREIVADYLAERAKRT